jgi:ketosteroid isomerase-like protein
MYQAVIEKWLDAWSGGDLDELDEIVAPDFVRHAPTSLKMVTHI